MRAIDTNVLVRLVAQDDHLQCEAAREAASAGAWVSLVVLVESVWVLKSHFGLQRTAIANTISVLLGHPKLVLEAAEAVVAALAAYKANKKIEFSDCLILETARRAGYSPLITFDRNFAKLDGVQCLETANG